MFTKTICTSGAPITVVPEGLLAVLRYNSNGQLEAIQLGYDPINFKLASPEVLAAMKTSHVVPLNISVTGGTSYVYGLFYCKDDVVVSGSVLTASRDALLEKLENDVDSFEFLASHPTSMAANFRSQLAIRNWLELNGFQKLPCIVAPNDVNDTTVMTLLRNRFKKFRWPLLSGYWIEKAGKQKFIPCNLYQFNVSAVKSEITETGSVNGVIIYDNGETETVSWSTILDFDIASDTTVVIEDDKIISSRRNTSKQRDKLLHEYVCPECGKRHIVEFNQGVVECEDPNCKTHLFTKITQFTKVLGLPDMTYEYYNKHKKVITCIPDIFELKEYKGEVAHCTFAKLLSAVISPFEVPNSKLFQLFADACSNTMTTINYYLAAPSHIYFDLHINDPFLPKFVRWLEVPANKLILDALLNIPQIQLVFSGKRFEGAPIFRGKKICVTGDFMHGSLQDVISILKSYDAEVSSAFNENAHCLIIGGLHTNIDGGIVHAARQLGIQVFEESDFFTQYDIDADLNANLQ